MAAVTKVVCVRDGVLFGARDRVRRLSRGRSSHGSILPQRPAGQILASCITFRRHDKTSQRGVVPPQPYQLKKFIFVLIIYVLIFSTSASAGGRL